MVKEILCNISKWNTSFHSNNSVPQHQGNWPELREGLKPGLGCCGSLPSHRPSSCFICLCVCLPLFLLPLFPSHSCFQKPHPSRGQMETSMLTPTRLGQDSDLAEAPTCVHSSTLIPAAGRLSPLMTENSLSEPICSSQAAH